MIPELCYTIRKKAIFRREAMAMRHFIESAMRATKKYTVLDFGILKVTLVSFGILLGTYFSEFFLRHTGTLWIVFLVTYIFIWYKTMVAYKR